MKTTKFKCAACGRTFERSIRIECEVGVFQGCPHCGCWDFEKDTREIFAKDELKQYLALARETQRMEERLSAMRVDGKEDSEFYEVYENNKLRCMGLRMRIQSFIFGIDDSLLRQVFTLKYIDGYSWNGVSVRLGGVPPDTLRIMHDRYLKKIQKG